MATDTLESLVETAVKDAGVDGFDLDIDSEGGISFVKPEADAGDKGGTDGKEKGTEGKDGVLKTEVKPADAGVTPVGDEAKTVSIEQYKELQGAFTKVSQDFSEVKGMVTVLATQLQEAKKGNQTTESESDAGADLESLLGDKTAFAKFISGIVSEAVESKLGKDAPDVMNRNRLGLELENTRAAHEDFDTYVPAISALVNEFPDASFEKLYQTAKKLQPVTPKPAAGESVTKENKPAATTETVETLKAKADALQTESGVNGTLSDKKKATTIKDAIAQALSEFGL
jgi:hypothetical protein